MRKDDPLKAQTRMAAIVIAVTMLGWMGINALGAKMGVPVRYAFLADLAAMAAFFWALVVLFRVWRQRQQGE